MRKRFYNLKRPKARQSWNKINLYNIARMRIPQVGGKTYFQQKWQAKSLTRAYHGEQVREKQWQRMFRKRVPAVVPMNYETLAEFDGSEQAAGRGSGLDRGPDVRSSRPRTSPYMHMTYYPVERRLDTAIFRALFASSTRQARQHVTHGHVKVNGKKMIYPGYLLNPGDMFQVEPERVLFATGARRLTKAGIERRQKRVKEKRESISREELRRRQRANRRIKRQETAQSHAPEQTSDVESGAVPTTKDPAAAQDSTATVSFDEKASQAAKQAALERKQRLQTFMAMAKDTLEDTRSDNVSGRRRQELRQFRQRVKRILSMGARGQDVDVADLDTQLNLIKSKIITATSSKARARAASSSSSPLASSSTPSSASSVEESLSPSDERLLRRALARVAENPVDYTKPYKTPWEPRPWMSAFAFIPRYLEVNQNICSAVYLRHPVVKPGFAEVPTPFALETSQLAFNWYLRRR